MTNIAYLLVMIIDLTSETWQELANGAPDHHSVLYRSGIYAVLAEISHTSHLGLGGPCWGGAVAELPEESEESSDESEDEPDMEQSDEE